MVCQAVKCTDKRCVKPPTGVDFWRVLTMTLLFLTFLSFCKTNELLILTITFHIYLQLKFSLLATLWLRPVSLDIDASLMDPFGVIFHVLFQISLLLHPITLILPLWPTFPLLAFPRRFRSKLLHSHSHAYPSRELFILPRSETSLICVEL